MILINCPFCEHPDNQLTIRDAQITKRGQEIQKGKCPACGSTFSVHVNVKRVRKGPKIRELDAQRQAALEAATAAAQSNNDRLAAELLADPLCDCGTHGDNGNYGYRTDGLESGGFLRGLPGPPRHRFSCPARKA